MPRQRSQPRQSAVAGKDEYPLSSRIAEPARALFQDMLRGYRHYRVGRRRHLESTVKSDIAILRDLVNYCEKVPGQLTPEDFDRWSYYLAIDRGIKVPTQRKYFVAVRVFLEYVIGNLNLRNRTRQLFGCDVIQLVTPESGIPHTVPNEGDEDSNRRAFLHEDLEALFDSVDRAIAFERVCPTEKKLLPLLRDKAMFFLMYVGGLRVMEVCGIDIDRFEPNPKFPEMGRFGFVTVFGKGRKWRRVPIVHPQLPGLLETYFTGVRPMLHNKPEADPNERAFFLTERGGRITDSTVRVRFKKHLMDAGMGALEHVPHNLRHSSVSHESLSGLDLESIRQMHGHTYASTTQAYMHIPNKFVENDFTDAITANLDKLKNLT